MKTTYEVSTTQTIDEAIIEAVALHEAEEMELTTPYAMKANLAAFEANLQTIST